VCVCCATHLAVHTELDGQDLGGVVHIPRHVHLVLDTAHIRLGPFCIRIVQQRNAVDLEVDFKVAGVHRVTCESTDCDRDAAAVSQRLSRIRSVSA